MSLNRPPETNEKEKFFSLYSEYTRILRTWLVAYGIGGPVLFVTNDQISKKIADSGQGACIAYLFLSGVLCQVILTLINKWVNWYIFATTLGSEKSTCLYRICDWISEQFWFDVVMDLGSIALFAAATIMILRAVV